MKNLILIMCDKFPVCQAEEFRWSSKLLSWRRVVQGVASAIKAILSAHCNMLSASPINNNPSKVMNK